MTNNDLRSSEQIENEIKEVLIKFQEGYTKRDKSIIDSYMDDLFEKGDDVVILGTSDEEWCLGFDEVKELVESDWEYWGDVKIDYENPKITNNDNVVWVATNGTVKYQFEHSDKSFDNYLGFTQSHFNEEDEFSKLDPKTKLTQILWGLSHFTPHRKEEKRTYYFPIRLTGVLTKGDGKWRFKYMQFSLHTASKYPEVKMKDQETYEERYLETNKKLKKYVETHVTNSSHEIKEILKDFSRDYLDQGKNIVNDYFVPQDDICAIDASEPWYVGSTEINELVNLHRKRWDHIQLDIDRAVINEEENIAWIATGGVIKKTITEEEAILSEIDDIKEIYNKDISSQEKLFQIQRNIARVLLETAKGEDYLWPVRFEGVLVKRDGKWLFDTIQFSFSYYWILEGKYDVPSINQ